MSNEISIYRIYKGQKPDGEHWDSVTAPDEALADAINQMTECLMLVGCDPEGSEGDQRMFKTACESLGIDYEMAKNDPYTMALESFGAIDAWETVRRRAYEQPWESQVMSQTLLVGFGGPNIEITYADGVLRYQIYWSGEWAASTTDGAACQIFEKFYDYFYTA